MRLDLPLAYTTIRRGGVGDGAISADAQHTAPRGQKLASAGHTVLEPSPLALWLDALPDPEACANLERVSVETAAGIVAEAKMGATLDDEANRNDIDQLMKQAVTLLRVKFEHAAPPPVVREWRDAQIAEAARVLHVDTGAAWDRVAAALLRKKHLSGDEVRALVAQADKASGFAERQGNPKSDC